MTGPWHGVLRLGTTALAVAIAGGALISGQIPQATTDRVAMLNELLARHSNRDPQMGYLRSVLDALGLDVDSQLLVFSKTGAQRAYTRPQHPRALFFDESIAIGYVPGAPLLELAAHDARQGVVFYSLDQTTAAPAFVRQTSCLTCHVSASTLGVPGMIARSHQVDEDGNVLTRDSGRDVTHQTPHPDRWGGWFVTSEGAPPPYSHLAHQGNITFSPRGDTSNQAFMDWTNGSPETRGYLSASSDIVALLVFDHQVHAINLLAKLNSVSRTSPGSVADSVPDDVPDAVARLANELADYLLFVGEAPPLTALTASRRFAERLEQWTPKDRLGRSFGQLDLVSRLMRYPCSYMIYSDAFDGLPRVVKAAVYQRMIDRLSGRISPTRLTAEDRETILEILRDTKPDFPAR